MFENDDALGERRRVERVMGHEEPDPVERRQVLAKFVTEFDSGALIERCERFVE